ncbi:MAG: chorismate mutase [Sphingomonadales bacterium]|nr:chorismate mutase [Sphingomonadales bacterium]
MTADKPDTSLEDIRREIDAIDDGLLQLLVRRFDASARVCVPKEDGWLHRIFTAQAGAKQ